MRKRLYKSNIRHRRGLYAKCWNNRGLDLGGYYMRPGDLIEIELADGSIKECYIEEIEYYAGMEGKIKKVYAEQTKFTAKEIKRLRKD